MKAKIEEVDSMPSNTVSEKKKVKEAFLILLKNQALDLMDYNTIFQVNNKSYSKIMVYK